MDLIDNAGLALFGSRFGGFADAGRHAGAGCNAAKAKCNDSGSGKNRQLFHRFLHFTRRHFAGNHSIMDVAGVLAYGLEYLL